MIAIENGYETALANKLERGGRETISKDAVFTFIAKHPQVMIIAKKEGLFPNLCGFKLPFVKDGKAYLMSYIIEPSCIRTTENGICYVSINNSQRAVLMFPFFDEFTFKSA